MVTGYTKPLYILPFDHRASYESGLFGWHEPLTPEQTAEVAHSKWIIYTGFQDAIGDHVAKENVGVLVDEQFGTDVLRDAVKHGFITAVSVEKSGQEEFDFIYGDDFPKHIEQFSPTFAKVLVRFNPEGDVEMNKRQLERLKKLSDYLTQSKRLFMFELLVPAEKEQLARFHGDKAAYDLELRPQLVRQAIRACQDAGVEPDVWKIEGLDRREDCEKTVEVARRDGRDNVGLIVLGRGAEEEHVVQWLQTAAAVPGFIGFAVGRTSFWQPIKDVEEHKISEKDAAAEIARRFEQWIRVFQEAKQASAKNT
ncbi:hypothetical protein KDA_38780 [Dictyobacter alpinus]|uniref:DUF2090 domain-containing protein n=1 Tax=Dictyobacter alpinus TaxID=2014873 RepID=A0A402BAM0_9CHLR|nr:DUF2090 domain-containing protein [Dictyobacter alpinus]GCE28394.1 hypothetical protein KDA_38780 [Dictyobacter alpinus]